MCVCLCRFSQSVFMAEALSLSLMVKRFFTAYILLTDVDNLSNLCAYCGIRLLRAGYLMVSSVVWWTTVRILWSVPVRICPSTQHMQRQQV